VLIIDLISSAARGDKAMGAFAVSVATSVIVSKLLPLIRALDVPGDVARPVYQRLQRAFTVAVPIWTGRENCSQGRTVVSAGKHSVETANRYDSRFVSLCVARTSVRSLKEDNVYAGRDGVASIVHSIPDHRPFSGRRASSCQVPNSPSNGVVHGHSNQRSLGAKSVADHRMISIPVPIVSERRR
jgi:hypothetical protein